MSGSSQHNHSLLSCRRVGNVLEAELTTVIDHRDRQTGQSRNKLNVSRQAGPPSAILAAHEANPQATVGREFCFMHLLRRVSLILAQAGSEGPRRSSGYHPEPTHGPRRRAGAIK